MALIVLAIGIVVNILMVNAIFTITCTDAPVNAEDGEAPRPAFTDVAACDQVRPAGFILLGLADVFAAALIVSELAKRR